MPPSGNGATPHKTQEQVASELRQRLERALGAQRTEEIWRDPASVPRVVAGEEEAATVAEIMMRAWRDMPEEDASRPARRRSGFRRGLQLGLVAAIAVWSLSILRRQRQDSGESP